MNAKKQYPVFKKSLAGVITILVLGSLILIRGTKEKTEFPHISGKIIYKGKVYEELPKSDKGKYRYLNIDTYPKMFEIFVGKDRGDFKPDYEQIDSLRKGDTIEIYFDIDPTETDIRLNRLIQFIDKDGKPYYIRGSKDKYGGYFIIGLGILLGAVLVYLKKTGRVI